jgi:hypothetical protein
MSSPLTFVRDLTLPLVAYLTGRTFNDIMLNAFRDARIEDLRVPFFCCSVDVNSFKLMVHRAGDVWRYVCAYSLLISPAGLKKHPLVCTRAGGKQLCCRLGRQYNCFGRQ